MFVALSGHGLKHKFCFEKQSRSFKTLTAVFNTCSGSLTTLRTRFNPGGERLNLTDVDPLRPVGPCHSNMKPGSDIHLAVFVKCVIKFYLSGLFNVCFLLPSLFGL